MVRIYGCGVAGGDIKTDDFATQMSKDRDAMLEASSSTAPSDELGINEQIVRFRVSALSKYAGSISGDYFAHVVAIKTGDAFLDKPVGIAIKKAIESLGYDPKSLLGISVDCINKSNKTSSDLHTTALDSKTIRQIIELVDPLSVIALDLNASQMLEQAFIDANVVHEIKPTIPQTEMKCDSKNKTLYINGRKHVFLNDFESSLNNIQAKRNAWAAIRTLKCN